MYLVRKDNHYSTKMLQALRQSLSSAIGRVFLITLFVSVLSFVVCLFLKEIPLLKKIYNQWPHREITGGLLIKWRGNFSFGWQCFAGALMFRFPGMGVQSTWYYRTFSVNGTFRKLFIILGLFGLVLLGWPFWKRRLQSRQQKRSTHILSTAVRGMTLLGIVIFIFAFFYVGMIPGQCAPVKHHNY